ncbi:MAG TPA: HlyD family efflux transporter periplasmic adaptor subunit [Gemmataceae bacterium]|nr:HlyD family efflux transporter periplasmic adaptor subunit [Gemmataceae bacterium]
MKKVVVGVVLVLVAAGGALGWYFWPWRGDKNVLRLPGVVEIQEVRLGSKIGGRVAEVKIKEGEEAEAGDQLLVFDAPELEAQIAQQQARVDQAEADAQKARSGARQQEIDAAWAAALSAYAAWQKAENGFRPEEIKQARDELAADEADLKLAQEDFDRQEQLAKTNSGKKADYDVARATLNRARARRQAAQAKLDLYLAGTREEEKRQAAADFARAWSNFDVLAAGNRYEDVAAAEGRAAEARGRLRELEANYAERFVKAPGKVRVEVVAVRKGDIVAPNQPVLRVLSAADKWVKIYVPETLLGKVRLGRDVELTVDSDPDKRFRGKVIQIASISEFTPRNVQSVDERKHQVFGVKVQVDDPEGVFKSGMAAEVLLPLQD